MFLIGNGLIPQYLCYLSAVLCAYAGGLALRFINAQRTSAFPLRSRKCNLAGPFHGFGMERIAVLFLVASGYGSP